MYNEGVISPVPFFDRKQKGLPMETTLEQRLSKLLDALMPILYGAAMTLAALAVFWSYGHLLSAG